MAHVYLDDELIEKLRPLYEDEWEKSRREAGKKMITANEVVTRIVRQAYDSAKKRKAI
jgi:hypothetical protein